MTLKKLGEEVLRQYARFNPNSDRKLHEQEVRLYCIQVLNQLLKVEYFNLHQKLGDAVPPHAIIATYEVDVVPANNPPQNLGMYLSTSRRILSILVRYWGPALVNA